MQALLMEWGPFILAGLIAWGGLRVEVTRMRADIARLSERIHGPNNPNSLISQMQVLANRLAVVETTVSLMERERGRRK